MKVVLPVVALFLFLSPVFGQNEYEVATPPPPPPPRAAGSSVPAASTLRARIFYEANGRPVRRTSVMLVSKEAGPQQSMGTTDANGNLVIKNLKAGKYYALVNAPGVLTPLSYSNIDATGPGDLGDLFDTFPPIVVDGVSDVETIIPVRTGGAISGSITYADGSPAIGVKVEVLRRMDDSYSPVFSNFTQIMSAMFGGGGAFKTDDRGEYRFAGLPPGEYVIKVTEAVVHSTNKLDKDKDLFAGLSILGAGSSLVSVFFQEAFDPETARKLKIEQSEELQQINITIPDRRMHVLGGKLVASKDKLPIRNARISVTLNGNTKGLFDSLPGGIADHATYTDDQGNWKFVDLPQGKYTVVAQAESSEFDEKAKAYGTGGEPTESDPYLAVTNAVNSSAGAGRSGVKTTDKPAAPKFTKKSVEFSIEERDLTDETIELSHGGTISGTVLTEDKKSLPGMITITASDESGEVAVSGTVGSYNYFDDDDDDDAAGKEKELPKSKEFSIDSVATGVTHVSVQLNGSGYYVKSVVANGVDLLKSPFEMKEGGKLANVSVVLAPGTGDVEARIVDADKNPVRGKKVLFVPPDPAKFGNPTFHRQGFSDEDGIVKAELPPYEFAVLFVPKGGERRKGKQLRTWIAEAVKKADVVKVDSGKTTRITIIHKTNHE